MPTTFADLGIPFPLFEAPVSCAEAAYVGLKTCSLCKARNRHCFALGIGADLVVPCPKCKTEVGLDVSDRASKACHQCGAKVRFPFFFHRHLAACYTCLRSGRVALVKDTELGMITWEQTLDGLTHGLPILNHPDFEMVQKEEGWTGARVPREIMLELLRTPTYESDQGERWLFCCRTPMVFLGEWNRHDFAAHDPDQNGQRLYEQIVEHAAPGFWEQLADERSGVYVFRCSSCARLRAHWDRG